MICKALARELFRVLEVSVGKLIILCKCKVLIELFQKFAGTGKKPGHAEGVAFRKAKRAEGCGAEPHELDLTVQASLQSRQKALDVFWPGSVAHKTDANDLAGKWAKAGTDLYLEFF